MSDYGSSKHIVCLKCDEHTLKIRLHLLKGKLEKWALEESPVCGEVHVEVIDVTFEVLEAAVAYLKNGYVKVPKSLRWQDYYGIITEYLNIYPPMYEKYRFFWALGEGFRTIKKNEITQIDLRKFQTECVKYMTNFVDSTWEYKIAKFVSDKTVWFCLPQPIELYVKYQNGFVFISESIIGDHEHQEINLVGWDKEGCTNSDYVNALTYLETSVSMSLKVLETPRNSVHSLFCEFVLEK